jgi:hypothetical protein
MLAMQRIPFRSTLRMIGFRRINWPASLRRWFSALDLSWIGSSYREKDGRGMAAYAQAACTESLFTTDSWNRIATCRFEKAQLQRLLKKA